MSEVRTKWIKDLTIVGEAQHNSISFDSRYKEHTELNGSSPTNVFLMSIISCSSMAIIAELNKKEVSFKAAEATIEADTDSSIDNPYHFTRFKIKYFFTGIDKLEEKSLIEAVKISHEKYCPMIYMIEKIGPVQYEIRNNDNIVNKSENWEEDIVPKCTSEICDIYYSYETIRQ